MKRLFNFTLFILMGFSGGALYAQSDQAPVEGLYKTEADFKLNKLTFELDGKPKDEFIHADPAFHSSKIVVKENGKKNVVSKDDYFGFKDAGKVYRFYKEELFEIIDTADFYLYKRLEHPEGVKGYNVVTVYYFSHDGSSPLIKLSVPALINAFPDAIKFHYSLDPYINSPARLVDYDKYSKCYKVKYLFRESLK